jgi:hypothetical protein
MTGLRDFANWRNIQCSGGLVGRVDKAQAQPVLPWSKKRHFLCVKYTFSERQKKAGQRG